MVENKQTILKAVRMRLKRLYFMFLVMGTVSPLILVGMLFVLYKLEAEELQYVSLLFAFVIPIQIVTGLFMYRRYKKIYDLDDGELVKTKFYLNIKENIYVKNYVYEGHIIQIVNGLDATSLLVDGAQVKQFNGPRVRNYKLNADVNGNQITAIYKQGLRDGEFSLFFNKIKLEEQSMESSELLKF